MTSADADAADARRAARGFTLLEVMLAFAILAVFLSYLQVASTQSFNSGVKAIDLRDIRVMADTVFRRVVYEHWKWNDGDTGTADVWYAEFAGLKSAQKDKWKIYRLVLHKKKGMVAGNDPTGRIENLFQGGDYSSNATGSTGSTTGTGGSSSSKGTSGSSGSSGTGDEAATGEPAYLLTLDIYLLDEETPQVSLRSIIPVPESEREEDK